MEIYRDGSIVNLSVPFEDDGGNPVDPTSVSYRVLSEDNSEIVGSTVVVIASGDTRASIAVDAVSNTLPVGVKKTLRTIELVMTTSMGIVTSFVRYVIESANSLGLGENSFQTYNQALLTSLDMTGLDRWNSVDDRSKKTALIEAYFSISKLNFNVGIIKNMNAEALGLLSDDLKVALARAQIAEAEFELGGDTVGDKRKIGIMSETTGESSSMFRSGKPLSLSVSDRALEYLSGHISWSSSLTRS